MAQDTTMELVQSLLSFVWVGDLDDDVSVSKPEIATRGSVRARRGRVAGRHVVEFLLVRRVRRSRRLEDIRAFQEELTKGQGELPETKDRLNASGHVL